MPTTNINVGKGLVPDIRLVGDWDKALKLITVDLKPAVLLGARQGQMAAAEKILKLIKANIRKNGPPGTYWPSYSIRYEMRKSKLGGNIDRKWRLTDTYYNNIRIIDKVTSVHVGVPANIRGRVNTDNPLTLGQIANILERGSVTANIQARPLWGPTFKQFGGKNRVGTHMMYHIRKNLYLATGLRSKITF